MIKILVDSLEYKCWHEIGHATVCVHLSGVVDFIEFLETAVHGHARTRCVVAPEMEKSVACGGFAAEFYLLKSGYAEQDRTDERDISQVVFHNATADREDFWGKKLGRGEAFSAEEDETFMNHAVWTVAPIFNQYFPRMQELVRELCNAKRIEGRRIDEVLRTSNPDGFNR